MDGDTIKVEDSILLSIKKLLGMDPEEFDQFDSDIIMYISATIEILNQIGVDIPNNFTITDKNTTWDDYIKDPKYKVIQNSIKNYIYMKVRLVFDPPSTSALEKAIDDNIKELEWRIRHGIEFPE